MIDDFMQSLRSVRFITMPVSGFTSPLMVISTMGIAIQVNVGSHWGSGVCWKERNLYSYGRESLDDCIFHKVPCFHHLSSVESVIDVQLKMKLCVSGTLWVPCWRRWYNREGRTTTNNAAAAAISWFQPRAKNNWIPATTTTTHGQLSGNAEQRENEMN